MQQHGAPYPMPGPAPTYAQPYGTARRTNGKAVAAFVCGIGGLVLIPLVLAIVAVFLGNAARRDIKADPTQDGDGLALAGIILGWIGIVIAIIAAIFVLIVVLMITAALNGAF